MKWSRLYSEARYDAKLRSLTAEQFRVWFNLLCFASDQPTQGVIESMNDRVLAYAVAEGDVALLNQTIAMLVALQCVTSVTHPVTDVPGAVERRSITFLGLLGPRRRLRAGPKLRRRRARRRHRPGRPGKVVTIPGSLDAFPV
jgi:hypothetical protein